MVRVAQLKNLSLIYTEQETIQDIKGCVIDMKI